MLVNMVVEQKQLTRVSFKPVMINQKSQPRCLCGTDAEFTQLVDYMNKITKSQKMATDYRVAGDDVVLFER